MHQVNKEVDPNIGENGIRNPDVETVPKRGPQVDTKNEIAGEKTLFYTNGAQVNNGQNLRIYCISGSNKYYILKESVDGWLRNNTDTYGNGIRDPGRSIIQVSINGDKFSFRNQKSKLVLSIGDQEPKWTDSNSEVELVMAGSSPSDGYKLRRTIENNGVSVTYYCYKDGNRIFMSDSSSYASRFFFERA